MVFKGWFGDFKTIGGDRQRVAEKNAFLISFSFLEGFGLINTGLVKMRLRA